MDDQRGQRESSSQVEELPPGDPPSSRRAGPRVAAAFRVRYENVDDVVESYTEDISQGGFFVKTEQFLPIGAVVRLHVKLPDEEQELTAIARVAFILDAEKAKAHARTPGMGMELCDMGGTPLADEIARYLAKVSPEAKVPLAPSGASYRVLVVDDDEGYRKRLAKLLKDAGHRLETAKNGVEALKMALEEPPDLIITDVQMPVMDGWQLVRLLRVRPTLSHIPVVFVTSLSSDEQRLQGYRLGVDDYVAKPVDEEDFSLRVERVLLRARAYPRNSSRGLRGDLGHVSPRSLLSFLEFEKRTGVLLIVRPDEVATLHLREGEVVRIDTKDQARAPVECLYDILDWNSGRFELADAEVTDDESVAASIADVLVEHARRKGEPPGSIESDDDEG